ncbi:NAD-dependent epimerase/dehydratase family protein [Helicobacter muridarum]|uniref:UDP-glucose 4-epimerase n=1 Tax=Helicobacter muridarum TaxID=216 RepID=A0A377PT81_9HELI|nr:NAD-dependent epimerase/dehydratase family protein [Helicobacter muridarum]STQ85855.1 UDP-glucose 4-epimerase [Helicobacter muridarum]
MPTITNNASINLSLNYPDSYVLIIGGAGYIGSNTNALLNSLGVRTIVYDSLVYGHKEALDFTPLQSLSLESSSYGGGGYTTL